MPQQPQLIKKPESTGPIGQAYGNAPAGTPAQGPLGFLEPYITGAGDFAKGVLGFGGGLSDPSSSKANALGDAFGQINPEHMMLAPIAGMTKFINPIVEGGKLVNVPDKARRIAESETRVNQLVDVLTRAGASEEDIKRATDVAKKYPRTTAHIQEIETKREMPIRGGMAGAAITPFPTGKSRLSLSPDALKDPTWYLATPQGRQTLESGVNLTDVTPFSEMIAHELQHVGQNIKDPQLLEKYNAMNKGLGYELNPYEIAARQGAIKRIYGVKK